MFPVLRGGDEAQVLRRPALRLLLRHVGRLSRVRRRRQGRQAAGGSGRGGADRSERARRRGGGGGAAAASQARDHAGAFGVQDLPEPGRPPQVLRRLRLRRLLLEAPDVPGLRQGRREARLGQLLVGRPGHAARARRLVPHALRGRRRDRRVRVRRARRTAGHTDAPRLQVLRLLSALRPPRVRRAPRPARLRGAGGPRRRPQPHEHRDVAALQPRLGRQGRREHVHL
mmetsp:Transcript_9405/g.27541  ORF Transcript_9405/g.27541 Transcript_9405/m.27541 type:complete len:228 (+) Transcript_9405:1782-2465(+)